MERFQILLSNSTCAASPRLLQVHVLPHSQLQQRRAMPRHFNQVWAPRGRPQAQRGRIAFCRRQVQKQPGHVGVRHTALPWPPQGGAIRLQVLRRSQRRAPAVPAAAAVSTSPPSAVAADVAPAAVPAAAVPRPAPVLRHRGYHSHGCTGNEGGIRRRDCVPLGVPRPEEAGAAPEQR